MSAEDILETEVSRVNKIASEATKNIVEELVGDWSGDQMQELIHEALGDMTDDILRYILKQLMVEAVIRDCPHLVMEAAIDAAHDSEGIAKETEVRSTKAAFRRNLDQIADL